MSAPEVWDNAYLEVDGINLTGYVRSLAVDIDMDTVEKTAMGDGCHIFLSGLQNWAIEGELNQETSTVDAVLSPIARGTSQSPQVKIRQTTAAVSTGNKQFHASAVISAYRPYGGTVGDMTICTVSFVPGAALTYTTS